MQTLFISDLHLDKKRPEVINYFTKYIKNLTEEIDSIYILGEFVEYNKNNYNFGIMNFSMIFHHK